MDSAEACHSWGLDSLTGKSGCSFRLLLLVMLTFLILSLGLRRLLSEINMLRNTGNMNASIANASFARADDLSLEFLKRIHRLAGEDFDSALTDVVFNEDAVIDQLGDLWEMIAPTPIADMPLTDPDLQELFSTIPMAAGQAPAGSQAQPIVLDDDDADYRHDDIYGDDDEAPLNLDALIDNEAEEMPADHESVVDGDDDVEMDAPDDANDKDGEDSGSEEESSEEGSSDEEESSEEEIPARKKQRSA
jgi:hypothetical protein